MSFGLALLLLRMTLLCSCGGATSSSSSPGSGTQLSAAVQARPIVIVLEENESYEQVAGSSSMPFLNSLAQQYALASNYFATGHDSLPDYFMLTSGQFIGQDGFTGVVSDDNVVRELTAAGRTWKAYEESLPSPGYLGDTVLPYDKNHNPFAFFSDVLGSATQQASVVPFSQFAGDVASNSLPDYAFVVPNDYDNSHSCIGGGLACPATDRLAAADSWLKNNIGTLLSSPQFIQNGLLMVVFDESDQADVRNGGGHVALVMAGPHVKRGFVSSTLFSHPSTLRLSLRALGVTTYPGAAASAPDMDEFFQ